MCCDTKTDTSSINTTTTTATAATAPAANAVSRYCPLCISPLHSRRSSPVPSHLSSQRDRDCISVGSGGGGGKFVNRNPRRLFTFMEETALAHARTVMELIDDIASSYSDDFVTGDYILQIQVCVCRSNTPAAPLPFFR